MAAEPNQTSGFLVRRATLDQPKNHWGEDQLHRQTHSPAWTLNGVGPGHERVVQHSQEVRKVDPVRVTESDDQLRFVRCVGMDRAMNGLDVSTNGTRWKSMSVLENCPQI